MANADAEIYEAQGRFEREYFACAFKSGRAYALGPPPEGTPEGGGGVPRASLTLAGTTVAYEEFGLVTEGPAHWRLIVRDLRTGRRTRRMATGGSFVESVVLKPDGSIAWIVDTNNKPREYAVIVADARGVRTVATGSDIVPASLALAGSTVYWTQHAPMSAPLL